MRTDNYTYSKTSIYLRDDIKERIGAVAPRGKQTNFINDALNKILENLESEKNKQELLHDLKSIKPKKAKGASLRETLEQSRKARDKELLKRLKN